MPSIPPNALDKDASENSIRGGGSGEMLVARTRVNSRDTSSTSLSGRQIEYMVPSRPARRYAAVHPLLIDGKRKCTLDVTKRRDGWSATRSVSGHRSSPDKHFPRPPDTKIEGAMPGPRCASDQGNTGVKTDSDSKSFFDGCRRADHSPRSDGIFVRACAFSTWLRKKPRIFRQPQRFRTCCHDTSRILSDVTLAPGER